MAAVTVAGAGGSQVTIDYPSAAYAALAESLLNGATATVVDTSGTDVMPADGPPDTVIGPATGTASITLTADDMNTSADQVILVSDGTSLTFMAPAGGGTLIAGTGADIIDLSGSDPWDVFTGPTGSVVNVGDAGGFIVLGGPDTVTAGAGTEVAFGATAGGSQITGGSGTLLYAGAAGAATITAGSGMTMGFGGSGQSTYDLSTGQAVLIGGPGTMIVNGGAGAAQMFGSNGTAIDFTGAADNVFVAGAGNETLNGAAATGANSYFAGSGNDAITAGSGNDVLFGGTGNATLQGGGGANVFAFVDQAGSASQDTIVDFTAGDTLDLIGGLTIASQQTSAAGLVVLLSDNTQLTFSGLTSDLTGGSVIYS